MNANWSFPRLATASRRATALAAALIAAIAIACASDDTGATATPDATETIDDLIATAGPVDEILRAWVQDRLGQGFVSRCEDAERPHDVGKQCAMFHSERDGRLAYQLGPTFSAPNRLFILELQNGDWTIISSQTYSGELTSIPWPLAVGAAVVVSVDEDCLRIRDEPGLHGILLDCLDDGTPVTIGAGPAERDNITWWRLEGLGWAAGSFLRYPIDES